MLISGGRRFQFVWQRGAVVDCWAVEDDDEDLDRNEDDEQISRELEEKRSIMVSMNTN